MAKDIEKVFIKYFDKKYKGIADSMAITGSFAVDLQTSKSDIDLILLVGDASPLKKQLGLSYTEYVEGLVTEILVVDEPYITNVKDNAFRQNYYGFDLSSIRLAEKIISARPITGKKYWKDIFATVEFENYKNNLVGYHQVKAVKYYDDVVGEMVASNHWSIIHLLRAFLYHILEALLCLHGDTNGREKWIIKRLLRSDILDDETKKQCLKFFMNVDDRDINTLNNWIDTFIRFTQYINSQVLVYQIFGNNKEIPRYNETEFQKKLITTDVIFVTKLMGQYYLKTPEDSFVVDEVTTLILAICNKPTTVDDLVKIVSTSPVFSDDKNNTITDRIDALENEGIIKSL